MVLYDPPRHRPTPLDPAYLGYSGDIVLGGYQEAVETVKQQSGHIPKSPFQTGPTIAKGALGTRDLEYEGNAVLLSSLMDRLRLRRGEDGWFCQGKRGQLWEMGIGKLGFTVGTGVMVKRAVGAGYRCRQLGDGEANFELLWTGPELDKIITFLGLQKRRRNVSKRGYRALPKKMPRPGA